MIIQMEGKATYDESLPAVLGGLADRSDVRQR